LAALVPLSINVPGAGAAPRKASAASSPETFAGVWLDHGDELFIDSYSYKSGNGTVNTDWYGVRTDSNGEGAETDLITLNLVDHGTQMQVTTTGSTFMSQATGTSAPNPDPKQSFVRGDTYTLVWHSTGVLETVDIHTHYPGVISNRYWCGSATPPAQTGLCGL
jgi:hypothetical protein